MDVSQKTAFILSQVAVSQARVASMVEQNNSDRASGRPTTYLPWQIEQVPLELGLGHNDVLIYLTQEN